jgi:phosphogluconate dehydratase
MLRINATVGSLNVLVDEDTWFERKVETLSENKKQNNSHGMGRELFGALRKNVLTAEEGAVTWI